MREERVRKKRRYHSVNALIAERRGGPLTERDIKAIEEENARKKICPTCTKEKCTGKCEIFRY